MSSTDNGVQEDNIFAYSSSSLAWSNLGNVFGASKYSWEFLRQRKSTQPEISMPKPVLYIDDNKRNICTSSF